MIYSNIRNLSRNNWTQIFSKYLITITECIALILTLLWFNVRLDHLDAFDYFFMYEMFHTCFSKSKIPQMSKRETALLLPFGSVGKHNSADLIVLILFEKNNYCNCNRIVN